MSTVSHIWKAVRDFRLSFSFHSNPLQKVNILTYSIIHDVPYFSMSKMIISYQLSSPFLTLAILNNIILDTLSFTQLFFLVEESVSKMMLLRIARVRNDEDTCNWQGMIVFDTEKYGKSSKIRCLSSIGDYYGKNKITKCPVWLSIPTCLWYANSTICISTFLWKVSRILCFVHKYSIFSVQ